MEAVSVFFFATMLASVPLFFLGMIKPSLLRAKTRGRAALVSFYLFAASFVALIFFLPKGYQTEQSTEVVEVAETAQPEYKIFKRSDYSMPSRKRIQISILASDAKTKADRVAVVMRAAMQVQAETGASVVRVALEPAASVANRGSAFALAAFVPDGCGQSGSSCDGKVWEIEAAETQVSAHELAVWEAWNANRDGFEEDGDVNEAKLKAFLASQFKVDPESITLPTIWREPVSL